MSHKAGSFELPQDALPLIKFYRQLYDATNGKVTPFIGSVLEQAGYDANYTFNVQALTTPPAWDDVMSVRGNRLTLSRPAMLDFGAAGKGYLADIVVTLLTAAGIDECTVDAGGDIYNHSATQQRQRVALEHPLKLDEAIGVATISNQSICASAGNRRAWDDFHHIIDPELLVSPRQILACWIVADTAMLADGLATAVYFVKPDTLQETFKFEYALLNPDMSLDYSRKFPAELFTT
jgi:thiamine biosynthesis lipoprotein